MDWKTIRRNRLKKTENFESNPLNDSWWGRSLGIASDWWARFHTYPIWEKFVVAATAVLLVVLTPIAVVSIFGGNDGQTQASPLLPTPTLFILAEQPTSTATITPTVTEAKATPTAENTPTATQLPNRRDCDAIAATAYRSQTERTWYLQNCVDSGPPPPPGVSATATPSTLFSPSRAASLAAQWIENSPAFGGFTVTNGGCAASVASPGQWRVGCQGETPGCEGANCIITLYVCLNDDLQQNLRLC